MSAYYSNTELYKGHEGCIVTIPIETQQIDIVFWMIYIKIKCIRAVSKNSCK